MRSKKEVVNGKKEKSSKEKSDKEKSSEEKEKVDRHLNCVEIKKSPLEKSGLLVFNDKNIFSRIFYYASLVTNVYFFVSFAGDGDCFRSL